LIFQPENLLLTSDGHIKIADFGSVKPTKDTPIKVLPNSTNERACTFVGTAAYVPPEVLNSAPPTFGNDLWALGCTLYQLLSGSSPFKDASEWLIFQRIIARDLKIPEYFSDDARDLIDKLLDVDPSKRPGAGPDGYVSLKKHPFFRGIDWKNIRSTRAPKLAMEANVISCYLCPFYHFILPASILLTVSRLRQMRMKIVRIQVGCHTWEVLQSTNMSVLLGMMVPHHLLKYAPIYLD
jgi:serine/threonine protein kinase